MFDFMMFTQILSGKIIMIPSEGTVGRRSTGFRYVGIRDFLKQ